MNDHDLATTPMHRFLLYFILHSSFFFYRSLIIFVQVITDAEVAVVGSQTNARQNDLPPKYEDVAEIPPKYDEATMKPNEN